MQLVRIRHERCNEYSCTSFVLAPDEWSPDDIKDHVDKAQDAYLEHVRAYMKLQKMAGPVNYFSFQEFLTKAGIAKTTSIAEAETLFEEAKSARRAYDSALTESYKRFENYLQKEGFITLYSDEAEAHILDVDADWGHRHSWPLKYGDNNEKEFPSVNSLVKAIELEEDEPTFG